MVFAIAEQAPGSVKFSALVDGAHAPSNLGVTNRAYDENSQLLVEQEQPLSDWVKHDSGWVGYASFDTSGYTGRPCFAFAHKGGSPQPLATFSYMAS